MIRAKEITLFGALALVAVLALLIATLGLTLSYRARLGVVTEQLISACEQRRTFDANANVARLEEIVAFRHLAEVARGLPLTPADKIAVVQSYEASADALQRAVDTVPDEKLSCRDKYQAAGAVVRLRGSSS